MLLRLSLFKAFNVIEFLYYIKEATLASMHYHSQYALNHTASLNVVAFHYYIKKPSSLHYNRNLILHKYNDFLLKLRIPLTLKPPSQPKYPGRSIYFLGDKLSKKSSSSSSLIVNHETFHNYYPLTC